MREQLLASDGESVDVGWRFDFRFDHSFVLRSCSVLSRLRDALQLSPVRDDGELFA
jgi:hypothetical protein